MELNQLLSVPTPPATNTYAPISHSEIHKAILAEAKDNGFEVSDIDIRSKTGKNCIVMYGLADKLSSCNDPEIGIRVGFKNSYDRTMSFGFALGSVVFICGNGMVSGEYSIKKQHRMKDLNIYAKDLIHEYFARVRPEHMKNIMFANELKKVKVCEDDAARIIGELFINNKIINQSQLRKMTSEMYTSEKFKNFSDNSEISAWDLYNHGTESLKSAANTNHFIRHIGYNDYFKKTFKIV